VPFNDNLKFLKKDSRRRRQLRPLKIKPLTDSPAIDCLLHTTIDEVKRGNMDSRTKWLQDSKKYDLVGLQRAGFLKRTNEI
jgi:hypothetical protein